MAGPAHSATPVEPRFPRADFTPFLSWILGVSLEESGTSQREWTVIRRRRYNPATPVGDSRDKISLRSKLSIVN